MSEQSGETKEVENKKDSAKRLGRNIVEMKYDKNEDCTVCLREMKNTTVQHTLCGHTFHSSCLEQQFTSDFNNNNKCALCRKEITDEKKTDSARPTRPSDENERDFNDSFIKTYSDLTDMFGDTYKLNTKITEKGSIDDGDKEMMRELKENISSCSIWLIEHLQSANDIHVQGTQVVENDIQVEEKDVDIETLLMIVENTYVSVLNTIGQTIPIISNTCSLTCLEELEYYIKMNHDYKETVQNNRNSDIERIKREREAEQEDEASESEDEASESEDEASESEDEASESEDEASESEDEASESEDEAEAEAEAEAKTEREREEREMEEKEIKVRETDFNNLNNDGCYTADGNVFDGEYNDGKFNGYCHYTFANGNVYQGECKDGKFNGGGKKTFANGNKYAGDYKDGLMDGRGRLFIPNGFRLFIPNGFSFQDLS